MTSPLLPYANGYLLVTASGAPSVIDGRISTSASAYYVIQCYLKRQDSTGTETGAEYYPVRRTPGDNLPGASGQSFLYRGYALRFIEVTSDYSLGDQISGAWTELSTSNKPTWLTNAISVQHLQGSEEIKTSNIEVISGKYGGTQIDEVISVNIKGLPIVVRSSELTN